MQSLDTESDFSSRRSEPNRNLPSICLRLPENGHKELVTTAAMNICREIPFAPGNGATSARQICDLRCGADPANLPALVALPVITARLLEAQFTAAGCDKVRSYSESSDARLVVLSLSRAAWVMR